MRGAAPSSHTEKNQSFLAVLLNLSRILAVFQAQLCAGGWGGTAG